MYGGDVCSNLTGQCYGPLLPRHCAGDVVMVQPDNVASSVEEFLSLFSLDPHQLFLLEENDPGERNHHCMYSVHTVYMRPCSQCIVEFPQ